MKVCRLHSEQLASFKCVACSSCWCAGCIQRHNPDGLKTTCLACNGVVFPMEREPSDASPNDEAATMIMWGAESPQAPGPVVPAPVNVQNPVRLNPEPAAEPFAQTPSFLGAPADGDGSIGANDYLFGVDENSPFLNEDYAPSNPVQPTPVPQNRGLDIDESNPFGLDENDPFRLGGSQQSEPGESHPDSDASLPEDACINHANEAVTHRCVGCLTEFCESCVTNPKHPRMKTCPSCGDTALPATPRRSAAPDVGYEPAYAQREEPVYAQPIQEEHAEFTAEDSFLLEIPAAIRAAFSFHAITATMMTSIAFYIPVFGLPSAAYVATTMQSAAAGETGLGRLVRLRDQPLHWLFVAFSFSLYYWVGLFGLLVVRFLPIVNLATPIVALAILISAPIAMLGIALNESPNVIFRPAEILSTVFSNLLAYFVWMVVVGCGLGVLFGISGVASEISEPVGMVATVFITVFGLPHLYMFGAHLLGRLAFHSQTLEWPTAQAHDPGKPANPIVAVLVVLVFAIGLGLVLSDGPSDAERIEEVSETYLKNVLLCRDSGYQRDVYRSADLEFQDPAADCRTLFGDKPYSFDYEISILQDGDTATAHVTGEYMMNSTSNPLTKVFTIDLTHGRSSCPSGSTCSVSGSCEPDGSVAFEEPVRNRCVVLDPKVWTVHQIH